MPNDIAERIRTTLGWLNAGLAKMRPDAQARTVGTIERLTYLETLVRMGKNDAEIAAYVQQQLDAGDKEQ